MKIVRYGIFFSSLAIAGAIVVCRPEWLASNTFVQDFVGPDLLSLLVVILTITFASVANIHLSLNRFQATATPSRKQAIEDIRGEINDNAWLIFSAFIVCVVSLLAKGALTDPIGVAATDAICLLALLVNALVMHDLYHAIFALASAGVAQTPGAGNDGNPDFTQDSPPAG